MEMLNESVKLFRSYFSSKDDTFQFRTRLLDSVIAIIIRRLLCLCPVIVFSKSSHLHSFETTFRLSYFRLREWNAIMRNVSNIWRNEKKLRIEKKIVWDKFTTICVFSVKENCRFGLVPTGMTSAARSFLDPLSLTHSLVHRLLQILFIDEIMFSCMFLLFSRRLIFSCPRKESSLGLVN